jgi:hypothetical protein
LARLSYIPSRRLPNKCPAGVEPARPPWRGGRLPLHHGHLRRPRIVKEPRAPGGSRTHVAALRGRSLRRWTISACFGVGPEGLEPSPNRLRAGRSAARTSVPSGVADRPGRSRTSAARLSAGRSPVELQAACPRSRRSASHHGARGIRTPADRLKRPTCCRYTTTPGWTPRAGACV